MAISLGYPRGGREEIFYLLMVITTVSAFAATRGKEGIGDHPLVAGRACLSQLTEGGGEHPNKTTAKKMCDSSYIMYSIHEMLV